MARKTPEINASSTADIAFLLLVFFLVTTTMDVDSGITRRLSPPVLDETKVDVKERNILKVLVNKSDRLLVDDKPGNLRTLREDVKTFIVNPMGDEKLPEKKLVYIEEFGAEYARSMGIVSLKNDRGTSYDMYIKVQNELAAAFNELKDELAQEKFGKKFDNLSKEQMDAIGTAIPTSVSEAEPENIGD
ncbi:MAG: biopolymer transporter ExbD [Bacteroidales bacterium]|nr:biopolymer transporter ExbD [Bacteroidales bacterium]